MSKVGPCRLLMEFSSVGLVRSRADKGHWMNREALYYTQERAHVVGPGAG